MFPVRCRLVRGLSGAVVLMPGAGYNLQSLPGYVGNNPGVINDGRPMNAFQMYNPSAMQTVSQPTVAPVRQVTPRIYPRIPPRVVESRIYPKLPPLQDPAPPIVNNEVQATVQVPPAVHQPIVRKSVSAQPVHTTSQPQTAAPENTSVPVKTPSDNTATVLSIGAAGIVAALLFK